MTETQNGIAVISPHDKLIRESLEELVNARSFLQHNLKPDVLALIDLNSLSICKDTFVDQKLAEYYSDILYAVNLAGAPGFVYVLIEHKSRYDKYVHLQLLEYMVKIWRFFLKQQNGRRPKDPLPVIIPLLISHGTTSYPLERIRLASLLTGPVTELARFIPDFGIELYDLSRFSDDEIKGEVMLRVVLLLLKYSSDPVFLDKLPEILALMQDLLKRETGLQYLEVVLRYILSVVQGGNEEEIKTIVAKALSNKEGEYVMTLAEKLRSEGEIRGKIKGEIEGEIRGKIKGKIEGKIENLEELQRYGILSREQMERFMAPLRQQLQNLKFTESGPAA